MDILNLMSKIELIDIINSQRDNMVVKEVEYMEDLVHLNHGWGIPVEITLRGYGRMDLFDYINSRLDRELYPLNHLNDY